MKGMTEKDERIKDAFHLCRWTNSSAGGSTLYITSHIIGSTNFYEQTNIRPNVFISYFNTVLQKLLRMNKVDFLKVTFPYLLSYREQKVHSPGRKSFSTKMF